MKMTAFLGTILLAGVTFFSQSLAAQTPSAPAGSASSSGPAGGTANSPNMKALKAYYTAFETNDWSLIEPALADGFTFSSPLDDHIDVKTFKKRCWPNAGNIQKFELVKVVMNGDEAFVIYNGWTKAGKLFRNSDYFKFKNGKIRSYECFFGPGVNYPNSGK